MKTAKETRKRMQTKTAIFYAVICGLGLILCADSLLELFTVLLSASVFGMVCYRLGEMNSNEFLKLITKKQEKQFVPKK